MYIRFSITMVGGLLLATPVGAQDLPHDAQPTSVEGKDALAAPSPVEAAVQKQSEELQRLRSELASLQEEMRQGKIEARKENRALKANLRQHDEENQARVNAILQKPRVDAGHGWGLSGMIQSDWTVRQVSEDQVNAATGAPLNETLFMLRRARLKAKVVDGWFGAACELDLNTVRGLEVRPQNVEAGLRWPSDGEPRVAVAAGLIKIPFGHEVVQSDSDRLFAERSLFARALFPGEYDLGIRLAGGYQFVRYVLAVQNGEPLGSSPFPARDPNQAKDVTGRLGMVAGQSSTVRVEGGFSVLAGKGFHKGVAPSKATVTWIDRNEDGRFATGELVVSPGSTGEPSQNFSRYAMGADARVVYPFKPLGWTHLAVEYVEAKNLDRAYWIADPKSPTWNRDVREQGISIAFGQEITSLFQVGLRFDRYNPDKDSTDKQSGTTVLSSQAVSTLAIAFAVRLRQKNASERLLLEYDWVSDRQGRDGAGLPADLKNNAFTVRMEAVF